MSFPGECQRGGDKDLSWPHLRWWHWGFLTVFLQSRESKRLMLLQYIPPWKTMGGPPNQDQGVQCFMVGKRVHAWFPWHFSHQCYSVTLWAADSRGSSHTCAALDWSLGVSRASWTRRHCLKMLEINRRVAVGMQVPSVVESLG